MLSPAEALGRAYRLLEEREVEAALQSFTAAQAGGADADACDAGRWQCLALLNRYGEAWAVSDEIAARAPSPFWDGRPLAGRRLIVRCLHGFGDALQMARYAPWLRARTAGLIFEANPEIVWLLRACDGVGEVITWNPPPAEPPEWDAQAEVMELPWIARIPPARIPPARILPVRSILARTAYLQARALAVSPSTQELVGRIAQRKAARPQIGLAWRSSDWDPRRTVPFRTITQAFPAGCDLYSLQQAGGPELGAWLRAENMEAAFPDLAARMAALDAVVTVDGVLAHLAGALGLPVLLLLPFAADWRWGLEAQTPWYPRTRLFRQTAPGDWSAPVAAVREHLTRMYGL